MNHSEYPQKSWLNPKIEIKISHLHGKGMFAKEHIAPGEVVVVWGGEFVSKEEAEKAQQKRSILVMQLDDDLFSIEERGDDDTYFMNHSCDPNVWMKDAITLVARRDILRGEELTADYALWEGGNYISQWNCVCGSSLCRKRITGQDWKIPLLQKRYKAHFSPLINKRINKIKQE